MGSGKRLGRILGMEDFSSGSGVVGVVRALLAETLGTFLFVFFGCAASLNFVTSTDLVQVSLAFGLVAFGCVQWALSVSGGHINPAVTAGNFLAGRIGLLRAILYIGVQCVGAIGGTFLLELVTPRYHHGNLGSNYLFPGGIDPGCNSGDCIIGNVTPVQGFIMELLITLAVVLVYLSSTDPRQPEDQVNHVALAMGLTLAGCHLVALPYTGCGANPARTLGPALVASQWNDHWVYWAGPMSGAGLAALIYRMGLSSFKRHEQHQYDITNTDTMKMHSVSSPALAGMPVPDVRDRVTGRPGGNARNLPGGRAARMSAAARVRAGPSWDGSHTLSSGGLVPKRRSLRSNVGSRTRLGIVVFASLSCGAVGSFRAGGGRMSLMGEVQDPPGGPSLVGGTLTGGGFATASASAAGPGGPASAWD
eukprot:snap_masked-scaffold294_size218657-processed-gene-1.4 protein:Tk10437 transcript:snap_masked-scaffold294_size218657-processed-gene-1.4-mRNA-1 annotation:"Aquaporin AQPAe.a "